MDDLTRMRLMAQLRRHEGVRTTVYFDSEGVATVGCGHNLESRPLSQAVIDLMLTEDVAATEQGVFAVLPRVADLSSARQGAIYNLAFNVGVAGLLGFSKMLAAIWEERWRDAARELLDSKYATQVGPRATELAVQLETDQWA